MKQIVVLTEASKSLGLGHLNRCLNLVEIFKEKSDYLIKFHISGSDSTISLSYNHVLIEWADQTYLDLVLSTADLVIVDSYQASKKILNYISKNSLRSLFIVDSKMCYGEGGANTVILFASPYSIFCDFPNSIKVLSGIDYLLFKDEILSTKVDYTVRKNIRKIVINVGGYFDEVLIKKLVSIIDEVFHDIIITILGKSKNGETIIDSKVNIVLIKFVNSLEYVETLNDADILICNGGQSLNEGLFLNKNCIVIAIAENQESNIQFWNQKKVIKYIGAEKDPDFLIYLKLALQEYNEIEERIKFLPLNKVTFNKNIKKNLYRQIFEIHE